MTPYCTLSAQPGLMRFRRPEWFIIIRCIFQNCCAKLRSSLGVVDGPAGSTHSDWPTDKSIGYIQRVFSDYLSYGGLSHEELKGKKILELGPGDNLGVALKFLAAGAARVTAIDKFFLRRNLSRERQIYMALREHCTPAERKRFDDSIDLAHDISFNRDRLVHRFGVGIEDAAAVLEPAACDLIVSRAVLMEIHSLDRAFRVMDTALRPGGSMIHKVAPLHDYRLFSGHGYHPLEFLKVSESLYSWMAAHTGMPNRKLIDDYRTAVARLGYEYMIHITKVLGSAEPEFPPGTAILQRNRHYDDRTLALIQEIRPRLALAFRDRSDKALMTESFFLVAQKPCRIPLLH